MNHKLFINYYECLQLSPAADPETIERVFRMLVRQYHPDNKETGDIERFQAVTEAHRVLADPARRKVYDAEFRKRFRSGMDPSPADNWFKKTEADTKLRHGILSLLYVARRRDANKCGLGAYRIERLLGCSEQDLKFHIWYLKEKGWLQRTDTGEFAITALGVDLVEDSEIMAQKDRLLLESLIKDGNSGNSGGDEGEE